MCLGAVHELHHVVKRGGERGRTYSLSRLPLRHLSQVGTRKTAQRSGRVKNQSNMGVRVS